MIDFICSNCLQQVAAGKAGYRCNCGGLWQLAAGGQTDAVEPFSPDRIQRGNPGLARYAPFLPQHIFLPVGNGTLLLGLIQGLEDLRAAGLLTNFPRLIAVQSANCAPLATAWERKENSPHPISAKPTLAEGIAIARPARGRELLALTGKYHISWQQVSEDAIEQAGQDLHRCGLEAEPTAAAAFAAFSKFCNLHGTPPDTLIPLTGNNFEIRS